MAHAAGLVLLRDNQCRCMLVSPLNAAIRKAWKAEMRRFGLDRTCRGSALLWRIGQPDATCYLLESGGN